MEERHKALFDVYTLLCIQWVTKIMFEKMAQSMLFFAEKYIYQGEKERRYFKNKNRSEKRGINE